MFVLLVLLLWSIKVYPACSWRLLLHSVFLLATWRTISLGYRMLFSSEFIYLTLQKKKKNIFFSDLVIRGRHSSCDFPEWYCFSACVWPRCIYWIICCVVHFLFAFLLNVRPRCQHVKLHHNKAVEKWRESLTLKQVVFRRSVFLLIWCCVGLEKKNSRWDL